MKITNVKAIRADCYCFARIETDEGIYGIGEGGTFGAVNAMAAQIVYFGEYLIGRDPLQIEQHWQTMFRGHYFRGATIMGAISAIDVALWDIAGKYYGLPVWKLLGGKARDKVRVYCHVYGKTNEELKENILKKKAMGFNALGHLSPFLDEPKEMVYDRTHVRNMIDSVERVHMMREVMGDDLDLCLEMHRRMLPGEAVAFIDQIRDTDPLFVEDPIPPGNNRAMASVRARSKLPIATGERLHTIFEFEDLLRSGAVDYLRVSLDTVGGITGARKIAAMAEAYYTPLVPHNPLTPVITAAEMQFCASIGNLLICEYPDPDIKLFCDPKQTTADMVTSYPKMKDGYVELSEEPGIGIDLVPDIETRFPQTEVKLNRRLNKDGSLRDQ